MPGGRSSPNVIEELLVGQIRLGDSNVEIFVAPSQQLLSSPIFSQAWVREKMPPHATPAVTHSAFTLVTMAKASDTGAPEAKAPRSPSMRSLVTASEVMSGVTHTAQTIGALSILDSQCALACHLIGSKSIPAAHGATKIGLASPPPWPAHARKAARPAAKAAWRPLPSPPMSTHTCELCGQHTHPAAE